MDTEHYRPPQSVQSERAPGTRMLNLTTRIIIPSRNNQKEYILKQKKNKNILTKESTRYGQNIIRSRLLQRKMSPLLQLKSLQNLNTRLLLSLNIRAAQMQSFTGRWTCQTSLHNMLQEVEIFRQLLDLPDPRETLPRSSTTVLGLDNGKG